MCTSDTESRKDLLVELFDELKASYLSCPLRVYCLWLAAIHPRNMPTGSKSAAGYRSFCFPQSRNNRDPGEWRYKSTLLQYVDGWGLDLCAQAAHRSKRAFFCKNFCFHAAFWCFARHFLLRLSLFGLHMDKSCAHSWPERSLLGINFDSGLSPTVAFAPTNRCFMSRWHLRIGAGLFGMDGLCRLHQWHLVPTTKQSRTNNRKGQTITPAKTCLVATEDKQECNPNLKSHALRGFHTQRKGILFIVKAWFWA